MSGFRGPSTGMFDDGTGGSVVKSSITGKPTISPNGEKWHPTVIYLLALLVVEWAVFVVLAKYL